MKRKPLLLCLFLIVTVITLSGCLPKFPKEIVGPTWTSTYTIPLIAEKYLNLGSDDEDGLGLKDVSLNYRSSSEEDGPATFDLFGDRLTIAPASIKNLEFPDPDAFPCESYTISGEGNSVTVKFDDLTGYTSVTLSEDVMFNNYINVYLNNAHAASGGVTLELFVADETEAAATTTIPPDHDYARLEFPGLTLTPESEVKIEVSGTMQVNNEPYIEPYITFEPAALELAEITFGSGDIETIMDHFDTEPFAFSLELPDDVEVFEVQLKEAKIGFTPQNIPAGLKIDADLIIEALDQTGKELPVANWSFSMENGKAVEFAGLKDTLNNILKFHEARTVDILLDIDPKVDDDTNVTITYPGKISLYHNFAIDLDYLTYASSIEGPEGSVDVPEEIPLEFEEVELHFTVENTSPVGLALTVWLSPNPIDKENPDRDPDAFKSEFSIGAANTETTVLTFDAAQFKRLMNAEKIYHRITFTNETDGNEPIDAEDQLKITAYAKAKCTINKR